MPDPAPGQQAIGQHRERPAGVRTVTGDATSARSVRDLAEAGRAGPIGGPAAERSGGAPAGVVHAVELMDIRVGPGPENPWSPPRLPVPGRVTPGAGRHGVD
ncbi:hypothetical protein [Micromonospora sp. IBHARD004]|uniref:hypothetical protein n=1 Tax=Micromonospora sp. IBHARD004 TaxID=3457764 RepID=UPI00405A1ECB